MVVLATETARVKLPETKPVVNVESIERQLYHLKSCTHRILHSTEDNKKYNKCTEMIDLITDVRLLTLSYFVYILKFISDLWFFPSAPVSSTNKIDRHDIAEILLRVTLNTINQNDAEYLSYLHDKYVIVPADKAPNVFVFKSH
jgi:hypothetical protein